MRLCRNVKFYGAAFVLPVLAFVDVFLAKAKLYDKNVPFLMFIQTKTAVPKRYFWCGGL